MTTLFGPVTRHHCPLPECGWSYDVDLGAEPLPPILLDAAAFDPVAFRVTDSRVLSEAISAASEKQRSELLERTETAIREHLQGHDFAEVVRALTEAQATVARVRAECDRIEAAVNDMPQDPDFDGACLRWIRAALDGAGEA